MLSGQSGHIAGCPGRPLTRGSSAPPPGRRSSGGIRAPSKPNRPPRSSPSAVWGGERGGKAGGAQTLGWRPARWLEPGPRGAGSYCPQRVPHPLPSRPLKPNSSSCWPTTLYWGPPRCMTLQARVQTRAWSRGRTYLQLYSSGRGTEDRTAMGEGDREVRTLQRWIWGDKTMSLGLHLGGSEESAQREPFPPCARDTWLPCQGSSGDFLCLSPLLGACPFPVSSRWSPGPHTRGLLRRPSTLDPHGAGAPSVREAAGSPGSGLGSWAALLHGSRSGSGGPHESRLQCRIL